MALREQFKQLLHKTTWHRLAFLPTSIQTLRSINCFWSLSTHPRPPFLDFCFMEMWQPMLQRIRFHGKTSS